MKLKVVSLYYTKCLLYFLFCTLFSCNSVHAFSHSWCLCLLKSHPPVAQWAEWLTVYVCVWQPNTPEPIVTWLPSDLQFLLRASMGCLECHIWQLNIQPCRYTGEEQSERWCTGTVPLCPSFSLTATGIPSTTAVLKCTSPTFSAPPILPSATCSQSLYTCDLNY